MRKLLPVAVIATLLISCQKDETNPNEVNAADKAFLLQTYIAGRAEIDAGSLAVKKTSNPFVRDFGQRIVADYNLAQADLLAVARELGLSLNDTAAIYSESAANLRELSGYSFDTAYVNSRVRTHLVSLNTFQEELNKGNNPYVRYYFFNKYIDKVRAYYQEADSLSRAL